MQKEDVKHYDLPDMPGVYFFVGARNKMLYIGKATSLRDRVRSYFNPDIADTRGPKIVKILDEATKVQWQQTDSVLEALILEAALIKKHQPVGNTKEKDDRSFNHIVITDEAFPRVLIIRGKDLQTNNLKLKTSFGPFPHGSKLKEALKIIRKIFPFRDTCMPCVQGNSLDNCKPCFNAQIGLCPGVCTGASTAQEYNKTIKHLTQFLSGNKQSLVVGLTADMHAHARKEQFEDAQRIKKQLYALQHIHDIALINSNPSEPGESWLIRVEGYDVAHISETNRVGVMVVVSDGVSDKNEYRKFTIKTALPGDTNALDEVLQRRLAHPEWPYPQVIVVDGSSAQINTAKRILAGKNLPIPVVGVVKDERHKPKHIKWPRNLLGQAQGLEKSVLLTNAEAHRFAIGFYRRTARKRLTS
jgi:excinuclease ABC subunit C